MFYNCAGTVRDLNFCEFCEWQRKQQLTDVCSDGVDHGAVQTDLHRVVHLHDTNTREQQAPMRRRSGIQVKESFSARPLRNVVSYIYICGGT